MCDDADKVGWFSKYHQSIGVIAASLSVIVASGAFVFSIYQARQDAEYKVKKDTLEVFLKYSSATNIRGYIARDPRLAENFRTKSEIPQDVVNDIEDIPNEKHATNDAIIREKLVDLVNYNEMLFLGRQAGLLDKEMFDLQFADIFITDYRILKKFLAYTIQNEKASYPNWAEALKEWKIDASDLKK